MKFFLGRSALWKNINISSSFFVVSFVSLQCTKFKTLQKNTQTLFTLEIDKGVKSHTQNTFRKLNPNCESRLEW